MARSSTSLHQTRLVMSEEEEGKEHEEVDSTQRCQHYQLAKYLSTFDDVICSARSLFMYVIIDTKA